jgi:uncharacterized protein YaiE (UPF0345 family)
MRYFSRVFTALALSCALSTAPVLPGTAPGYGMVISAERAHIGRAQASVGTTVFSGDTLDTEESGSLAVRTGAARLLLPASSRASWAADEAGAVATLKNGTALFSTLNIKAITLHASTATIRANADVSTTGSVTLVSPKLLTVSCVRGTLAISVEDDTKTIAEGQSYRVILDPDSDAQGAASDDGTPEQKRPKKAGKDKFLLILFFGGAAAALALVLALSRHPQPESPVLP